MKVTSYEILLDFNCAHHISKRDFHNAVIIIYTVKYQPTFEEVNWIAWQASYSSLQWRLSETLLPHSLKNCSLLRYDSAVVLFERKEKLTCCGNSSLQNHYRNQHWVACRVWAWVEVYSGFVQLWFVWSHPVELSEEQQPSTKQSILCIKYYTQYLTHTKSHNL